MAKEKSLLVPVIAIAAIAGAFRRCGHSFGKEQQHFAQDYFTEEQGIVLMNEPKLSLRMAEVDPAEVHVIGLEVAEEHEEKPETDEDGKLSEGSPNAGGSDAGETMLIGSSVLPAEIEIAEDTVIQLGKLVGFAQEQSGLDIDGWNAQPEDEREAALVASLELLRAVAVSAKDGKAANVNVVSKAMGGEKVSADQRDAAWDLLEGLKEPEGNT